jgi:hypothetical protein
MWASALLVALATAAQIYAGDGNGGLPVDKVYGVNVSFAR